MTTRFNPDAVSPLPRWLLRVVDKNYFMRVKHVCINGTLTDANVQWLADARYVKELDIDVSKSHQFLRQIGTQKQLTQLRIRAAGELDLGFLNAMPNLEGLYIQGATLRDFTPVANLHSLNYMHIRGCDLFHLETKAFKDMQQLTLLQIVGGDWKTTINESKLTEIQNYLPKCTVD